MGRFAAAKIHPLTDIERSNRAHNQLIDLLDKAYIAELSIDGKKIVIEVSPVNGFQITVDGVKVAAIDSNGNFVINRLADPDYPEYYATFLNDVFHGLQLWNGRETDPIAYASFYESISDGLIICDKSGNTRISIRPLDNPTSSEPVVMLVDSSGYPVLSAYDSRVYSNKLMVTESNLYVGTSTGGVPDLPHCFIQSTGYIQAGSAAYPENMIAAAHPVYSDVNIKENLQPYDKDSAYNLIKSLPIYSFNYINDQFKRFHVGTTYQDAPKEIAFTDIDEDILAVDTGNALFLAISAVQKLQDKIEMLEAKVKDLEARLAPSV